MPEENRKHSECHWPVRNRREWLGWVGRQVSLAALAALAALLGFRRGSPGLPPGLGSAQGGQPFCVPGMEDGMAPFRCRSCPGYLHCPVAEGDLSESKKSSPEPNR